MRTRGIKCACAVVLTFLFAFPLSACGEDCGQAKKYANEALNLKGDVNDPLVLLKMEELYRKAAELCPGYAQAWNNLGDVYEREGRYKDGIDCYQKAIKLAPTTPHPYAGLGDIYLKTGRHKEAKEYYEKALQFDSNDKESKQRLDQLKLILTAKANTRGVIPAEIIRSLLTVTRGPGEIVQLTFDEGLIPFASNEAKVKLEAKPQLDAIAKALKGLDTKVEIRGNTDAKGSDKYNQKLSEDRAKFVADELKKRGVRPSQLIPDGYGERILLCHEDTEACHALNRRVEIRKIGKLTVPEAKSQDAPQPSSFFRGKTLSFDVGFFYQKEGEESMRPLEEGVTLRSRSDRYFFFIRPRQDSYVYLIQEDAGGNVSTLFPKEGRGFVKARKDY